MEYFSIVFHETINISFQLITLCRRKSAETAGYLLHAEQRKLVLEEEKVRQTASRLTLQQQARIQVENENQELKKTLAGLELQVHAKLQENDAGLERMNSAATRLLQVQMGRLEVENKIGVDQQHASKAEEDLKQVQNSKQVQDAYIMQMNDRMEQCTIQLEQCISQTQAMESSTSETSENLLRAEEELATVKAEKKKMFTNWSNTVININKRDEALANFQAGVDLQKTELKTVKSKIDRTKEDIVACQTEHEMVTGISARITKFCGTNEMHIKKNKKETAGVKLELGKLRKIQMETESTLSTVKSDLESLEKTNLKLKESILQLEFEKKELEGRVFESLRNQISNEKSSSVADKEIQDLKEKISGTDVKLKHEKNRLSELEKENESLKLQHMMERHRRDQLNLVTSQLEEEERKISSVLKNTTNSIEKVESLINHAEKEFSELSRRAGEETSPLEATISRCREEIDLVSKYCGEKRKEWTKKQNQLIKIHLQQDEARQELEQSKNKYAILLEKKRKNEDDIRNLQDHLLKIRKRLENLDVRIRKLNSVKADDTVVYQDLTKRRNAKIMENIATIAEIEEEIEYLKKEITALESSQHFSLSRVRSVDLELGEWEDKVRSCQNTASHVGEEKTKGGELENLKCEVHYFEQKLKDLSRLSKERLTELEGSVYRRESLFERLTATSTLKSEVRKEKSDKTQLSKKINNLENALRKVESSLGRMHESIR